MDGRQAKWLIEALEDNAEATAWAAGYATGDGYNTAAERTQRAGRALDAWRKVKAEKEAARAAREEENDRIRTELGL